MTIVKVLLALAIYFNWDVHSMNVEIVFLNADLDTEIYIKILGGMNDYIKIFLQLKDLDPDLNIDYGQILRLRKFL